MAASAYFDAVQKLYVAYYGRPADTVGLTFWADKIDAAAGKIEDVVDAFGNSAEAQTIYGNVSIATQVNNVFKNILGRDADIDGLNFYANKVASGAYSLASLAQRILDGATTGTDAQVVANKLAAAKAFTAAIDTAAEVLQYTGDTAAEQAREFLAAVTADAATVPDATAAQTAVSGLTGADQNPGQTFALTKGLDNVPGTSGNDTIVGSIDSGNAELNTLSSIDVINGGAGTDTLKINHAAGDVTLGNLSNVEIVEVSSAAAAGVTVDSTGTTGVTNLNVIKAAGAVDVTAGATTDINVSIKDSANVHTVEVDGGKAVNVNLTNATSAITVGGDQAAAGAVTITATGAAASNAADTVNLGDISVTGGTTINVTQKATSDSSELVAGGAKVTHNQGDVTIVAAAATTTVTIKQDAAVDAASAAAVAGVSEVATVKFTALAKDGTVTVGGLTFTAAKALTAAEVAQAFANLSASAITPTDTADTTATGDTQGSGVYSNGKFTGSLVAGWNSGAASSDTVTFTAAKAGVIADLAGAVTTTQGVDAVTAKNTLGVTAGVVDITDGAALTTVTIDGYSAAGSQIQGTAGKLETLNLSNGGDLTVADTAATLALNLEKVGADDDYAVLTLTAAPTTLNVKSTGDNYLNLSADATKVLNVSGTGLLDAGSTSLDSLETIKVTETAGLTITGTAAADTITSVDTTATTGAVTVGINGDKATYAGGAGVDTVTVANADTAISKAIDLGAGDDKLTLNGTVVLPTVTIKGGDGVDTLSMTVASADAMDADGKFAAKLSGFEHLTLNNQATGDKTINVDNLGFSYVTTTGTDVDGLTLDKLANDGTVVLTASGDITVNVKDADVDGHDSDVLNVVARVDGDVNHGTLTVANVETINLKAEDISPVDADGVATIHTSTLALVADTATTLKVSGNANFTLGSLTADKLATINAADLTGDLTVTASGKVAMTITGGSGDDALTASNGASAKADVLVGGAGNDTLVAGSNSATLTGGDGNDTFVLTATAIDTGNKQSNTYSIITDFKAGDLLQLKWYDNAQYDSDPGVGVTMVDYGTSDVVSFGKLAAVMQPTSQLSDYVLAAMEQIQADNAVSGLDKDGGDAVWFKIGSDSYVVVDSGAASTGTFTNGEDLIVKLAGVDLANASWNGDFATLALI